MLYNESPLVAGRLNVSIHMNECPSFLKRINGQWVNYTAACRLGIKLMRKI